MNEHTLVASIPMANATAEHIEEDTGVASSANLKCSIVAVVGRDNNRVGDVVTNYDMSVGL